MSHSNKHQFSYQKIWVFLFFCNSNIYWNLSKNTKGDSIPIKCLNLMLPCFSFKLPHNMEFPTQDYTSFSKLPPNCPHPVDSHPPAFMNSLSPPFPGFIPFWYKISVAYLASSNSASLFPQYSNHQH